MKRVQNWFHVPGRGWVPMHKLKRRSEQNAQFKARMAGDYRKVPKSTEEFRELYEHLVKRVGPVRSDVNLYVEVDTLQAALEYAVAKLPRSRVRDILVELSKFGPSSPKFASLADEVDHMMHG